MKLIAAFILVLWSVSLNAQSLSISGIVKDAQGKSIEGATVYISNSKSNAVTSAKGEFKFSPLQAGTYELVVSMLGFDAYKVSVMLQQKSENLQVVLKENSISLNEVVVKSAGPEPVDPKNMKMFIKNFIGESSNAGSCRILNPEVLHIHFNSANATLEASSGKFIIIENRALGYKLNYLLSNFQYNLKTGMVSYSGSPYFEEMQGSEAQQKKWKENRQATYEGSSMHFFRSVFANSTKSEGFLVYRRSEGVNKGTPVYTAVNTDSLFTGRGKDFKDFRYELIKDPAQKVTQGLFIVYTRKREQIGFTAANRINLPVELPTKQNQISVIYPHLEEVNIDRNGGFTSLGFLFGGYWGWENIAELLPLDYGMTAVIQNDTPKPVAPQLAGTIDTTKTHAPDPEILQLISDIDAAREHLPVEKIYLHLDKPYYTTGDTIWLKAYLMTASLLPSAKSGIMYLELANDTNKVLLRRMLNISSGLGSGNIPLLKDEIPEGSYTIRAYTNLMRNFGEDVVFRKSFYVSNTSEQNWLIGANTIISKASGKENLRLGLKFSQLNKQAIGLHEMQLQVMQGKKTLVKDKVQTDAEGVLDVNFDLPERAGENISVIAEDLRKGEHHKVTIPVPLKRAENIDLQFMPEGGTMINNMAGRIGFKAIGEDGRGADVSGKIYSSAGDLVGEFKSTHNGMGSFYLMPLPNQSYTAKIILPDGTEKSYPLPELKDKGTALRIDNREKNDSLEVSVIIPASQNYFLIGQNSGVVYYAATIRSSVKLKVAKKLFPTGIVHFTLFNAQRKPTNERLTYIDHYDNLQISISPAKSSYKTRDNVALNIEVKDVAGNPVQGDFSVAVTDDGQVNADTSSTIESGFLLSSELKGIVEDPAYYFTHTDEAWTALDNLFLTQGWIGNEPLPKSDFSAEQELTVKGKVTNILNKPLDGVNVAMISTKPLFAKDTIADKQGKFVFKDFPKLDSAVFRIQAKNKSDKEFNVGIEVDQFKPPVFKPDNYQTMPWYINTDTTLLNYVKNTIAQKLEEFRFTGKENILRTVTITAKKVIRGSWNLNGPGSADLTLDENDTKKAGKMNLAQLLETKVPGFHQKNSNRGGIGIIEYWMTLHGNRQIGFIIDGMAIGDFGFSPQEMLEYFTAEDIKGIELMYPGKNEKTYANRFNLAPLDFRSSSATTLSGGSVGTIPMPGFLPEDVWIEITTRAGQGPLSMPTPGTFLFKTMPFAGSRQFYTPKYTIKNRSSVLPDMRSTIHWQPDVITDTEGKATISFFSADKTGTYTVIAEGTDLNGKLGSKTGKVKIEKGGISANSEPQSAVMKEIITSIDTFSSRATPEKIYLHLDKPYYIVGDTIWLKAYLLDGSLRLPSAKSGLIYLELANDTNKVILRRMLRVSDGFGNGSIPLLKDEIPEGSYTIRAYTNMMRNFGEDIVFRKSFYVSNTSEQSWLVGSNSIISKVSGKDNLRLGLKFSQLDNMVVGLREMRVEVKHGARTLLWDKVQTEADGTLDLNFNLPERSRDVYLTATDLRKGQQHKVTVPIPIRRPENIDLQFMPEGGNMVAGIAGRIGFKAIGEDGNGADVAGKIYNGSNEVVAEFKSAHKGMGSFNLMPVAGQKYTAKIILPDGTEKSYPLPDVKSTGTALRISNKQDRDSLEINVSVPAGQQEYYLIAQRGTVVCYTATIHSSIKLMAAKSLFPTGIAHFTLLSPERNPLNERIVYIDHNDGLKISISESKSYYKPRDSISVNIEVKDKEGHPVEGNFSVSVTDNNQVKADSSSTIQTYFLLSSDLKGTIEDPAYYFRSQIPAEQNDPATWNALDDLLLTQGWVRYDEIEQGSKSITYWQKGNDPKPQYRAEADLVLRGKVTNIFNHQLAGTQVLMLSTKPPFFKQTETDEEGRFMLSGFPTVDSVVFKVQAKNKNDQSKNVGITAEEYKAPVFKGETKQITPWYAISDTTLLGYLKNTIVQRNEAMKLSGNVLAEVTINTAKVIRGSKNLNGAGNADYVFDEQDILKAAKGTLLQLLLQKVPGFKERPVTKDPAMHVYGFITPGDFKLFVDGIGGLDPLEYFDAEDVRGIEVIKPGIKNNWRYRLGSGSSTTYIIEVTSRAGVGPMYIPAPGNYLYKPMYFAVSKQFYSPKYAIKDKPSIMPDIRSTIYWQPDVVTDTRGKATISFYSADKPGNYTIVTEGSDMNGSVGSKTGVITVRK